jgi:hypothetical protein
VPVTASCSWTTSSNAIMMMDFMIALRFTALVANLHAWR